jgi:hypothetical protein
VSTTAQTLARALGAGRVVIGVALCASPGVAGPWIGEAAGTRGGRVAVRGLGARDAALGLGTLTAASQPEQLRRWLIASAASDAVDFAATLVGPRTPGRTPVLALAAGALVAGLGAAATLA